MVKLEYEIQCSECGKISTSLSDYRCSCGKPLEVRLYESFNPKKIKKQNHSVWRYLNFFPYIAESNVISLGEGWTPLIKFSESLFFKLEFLNPTGSFKDRGSTVLVSGVHKLVKAVNGYIAEDSSGNAGASVAGYAARAGLKAKIFVPESVSGQKLNQTLFYGAEVVKVSGDRNAVTAEAQKPEEGKFYVGHVWHPIFTDGIRSLAYELAEQLRWNIPDRIYLPVSAGTLLLGVINGFVHLLDSGLIDKLPKVVACQTKQVSPLYHRLKRKRYKPPRKITSIADALISVNPPFLDLMVKKMLEVKGDAEIVDEEEIFNGLVELAKIGLFVEPSSAVAYSAYKKQLKRKKVSKKEKSLIVLTGTGLKSLIRPKQL